VIGRDFSPYLLRSGAIRLGVTIGGPQDVKEELSIVVITEPEAAAQWLRSLADDVERAGNSQEVRS
jgi:hypothetical protein